LISGFKGNKCVLNKQEGRLGCKSEMRSPKYEISFSAAQGVYLLRISSAKSRVVRKLVRL
jgi:hypothetical protein